MPMAMAGTREPTNIWNRFQPLRVRPPPPGSTWPDTRNQKSAPMPNPMPRADDEDGCAVEERAEHEEDDA